MSNDTINLFDCGALLNLRIRSWSARKMITRADLVRVGVDPNPLPAEICNLGRKTLVPKTEIEALTRIEQRARKAIERFSVPFGVASAHFIPLKLVSTVEQQLKELQKDFYSTVDSFIIRFDEMKAKIRETHPDFWEKCLKNHYPQNPKALRSKFQFRWFVFKVAGMDSFQKNMAKEDELRRQMQTEVGEFVGEYVTAMRDETIRFCELMTARVNGKAFGDETDSKKLTPKSISCFRKYVDRFRQMNIFGDDSIEKLLVEFKNTFLDSGVTPNEFESATVKNSISDALEAIRNRAASEGESASGFIGELRRKITL